ncbi:MAG: hypothetical protein H6825_05830 [Planctomycetes bacterium]|nr:hypothetical protein [Planctomycetota bacterium]
MTVPPHAPHELSMDARVRRAWLRLLVVVVLVLLFGGVLTSQRGVPPEDDVDVDTPERTSDARLAYAATGDEAATIEDVDLACAARDATFSDDDATSR